jgi:hypothetical protein
LITIYSAAVPPSVPWEHSAANKQRTESFSSSFSNMNLSRQSIVIQNLHPEFLLHSQKQQEDSLMLLASIQET